MPACPRCQHWVAAQAIRCDRCHLVLKAHGHPGIPLHRAAEGVLCPTCQYHQDDSCTFPQRPQATSCTLYRDVLTAPDPEPVPARGVRLRGWLRQHQGWLALGGLLGLCLGWVLVQG